MNRANVQKLIDHLRSPRRPGFGMESYFGYRATCGTCLCFGGHASLLALSEITTKPLNMLNGLRSDFNMMAGDQAIFELGRDWLGLDDPQAGTLFLPTHIAANLLGGLSNLTVAAGVRVLELMLETGSVMWGRALAEAGDLRPRDWLEKFQLTTVKPAHELKPAQVKEIMTLMGAQFDYEIAHFLALEAGQDIEVAAPKPDVLTEAGLRQLLLDPKDPDEDDDDEEESEDSDEEGTQIEGEPAQPLYLI